MMKRVGIIGAGVIGLNSAYYLVQAGYEVEIFDRLSENTEDNCSYGNAGMIVPSHFIPLAAPGMIKKGLKWMFKKESPFSLRFNLNPSFWKWAYDFSRNCNIDHVQRNAKFLLDFNTESLALYKKIASEEQLDFGLKQDGLLMVYNTEDEGVSEIEMARQGEDLGIKFNLLNTEEVNKIQGEKMNVLGGVHYLTDAHLNPSSFMKQMKFLLKSKGVKFHFNTEVEKIESKPSNAKITVNGIEHGFDKLVVATGFEVFDLLGNKSKVVPGKGYSFQLKNNIAPRIPTILCEAKVAITSYSDYTNVAGTMELGNANDKINQGKLSGLKHAVEDYFQQEPINRPKKIWHGFRPCTSNGIPVIEFVNDNVIVAGGHGMMGMSLGAASGKKVAELIA